MGFIYGHFYTVELKIILMYNDILKFGLKLMNLIKPPNVFKPDGKFTIFLAGSIEMGRAEDWQTEFCDHFSHYDINILNPRRDDWDTSWVQSIDNPQFRFQVDWELKGLEMSDLILMYLQPSTISPVSMLELGLYANSGKMVVCCPDGFGRRGNIDIVCEHHRIMSVENKSDLLILASNIINRNCNVIR